MVLALLLGCATKSEPPVTPSSTQTPATEETLPQTSTTESTTRPELTPTTAEFTISSPSVTPSEVNPGQQVTISAVVTNTGGSEGSYTVILKINDVEETRKQITIEAGKSETIDFSGVRDNEGSYKVSIDDKVGQFSVSVPTPTYTPPPTPSAPTTVIVWTTPSAPITLTVDEASNRATYHSGGVQVSGYFYKPSGTGPFPAVLVLHGKGGQNTQTRDRVSWFATQGYVAFAPDYFTPIGMTAEKFTVSFYLNNVDQAREVLGNGLEALKSLSYVAPGRLGVNGHSLGGYLSFILGTRDDVKGIVSVSGAYAPTAPARYSLSDICAEIKAPVLMFHCVPDTLVPIDHANTASNLLQSKGKQYEYIVYQDGGHTFDVPGGATYSATATADYPQKMLAFFKEKLQ